MSDERPSKHHIIPTSIGGPRYNPENYYFGWVEKTHKAYHRLIQNRPPSIVIRIIEGLMDENGEINQALLSLRDYKDWKSVFGNEKPAKVIEFLKKEFLPIEEKYLGGELLEYNPPRQKRYHKKNRKRA